MLEKLRARLAEINQALAAFEGREDYNQEDLDQINALSEEASTANNKILALQQIEDAKALSSAGTGRKTTPVTQATVGQDRRVLDPKAGFQTAGEFFKAVAVARSGAQDARLTVLAGAQESRGEDGGFLIPVDFRQEIQKKVTGDESLLPRTRQFQTKSNNLSLPLAEVAPWDTSSGIQAYWESEAGEYAQSKSKYGEASWKLNKLTAMVRVTEELLDDAPALQSLIQTEAPQVMVQKINNAIISGTGVGMPKGFLNSDFKVKVSKEGSQTADTVNFANVNKMLGRILPASFAKSVWLIHPALLEQIRGMKFDLTSSTPIPVYMPPSGVAESPYGTLYGRPILPMMGGVKAPGDEGDISLVDLSYYYSIMKTSGVKQDISTHVYFNTDEVAFKFSMRIGGHCPYKAPVTTENGSFTMSGFVTLEDR